METAFHAPFKAFESFVLSCLGGKKIFSIRSEGASVFMQKLNVLVHFSDFHVKLTLNLHSGFKGAQNLQSGFKKAQNKIITSSIG